MPTLVYSDVDGIDRTYALTGEPVLVGRAVECQIHSADPRLSRQHARFFADQGMLWVEDLGSSNGVFVGANKVVSLWERKISSSPWTTSTVRLRKSATI